MTINKRKIFFWIKLIVISYCAIGIALYYLQDKFIFHPEKLDPDYVFSFDIPFKETQIPINKTDTISLLKFFPKTNVKGVVLYFHGNRQNVLHYEPFVSFFTKKGYEVWMPDYPGFGKSTGERNEKKLYDMAWLVHQLALTKFKSDSILVYGKSLGTGIAAYAASSGNCRGLILETPYYSIPDLFNHYAFIYPVSAMSNYKIPTWEFLEEVKAPVVIFHGTNDEVIPYSCAARLKSFLKNGDKFITIENGKHNNLTGSDYYRQVMDSVLR